jgi:cell division protein FtsQ
VTDVSRFMTTTSVRPRPRARRWRRVVVALALGGLSGLGVVHVLDAAMRSDVLPIRNLVIEGAQEHRVAEIVAFAEVSHGAQLFSISLSDVKRRVEEHPWVRRATVRRVAPDGIEVRGEERVARAVAATPVLYVVDDSGTPFKHVWPEDALDLPVVTGLSPERIEGPDGRELLARAIAAIGVYERSADVGGRLEEVAIAPSGSLTLVLGGGLRVAIGNERFDEKIARLARVLRAVAGRPVGRPTHIWLDDERRPERVAVRLVPMAEVPAGSGT